MKHSLVALLLLMGLKMVYAQKSSTPHLGERFITEDLESILIEVREWGDSPKPVQVSLIEFKKNKNEIFLLSKYRINGKRKGIGKATEIDKQRIDAIMEWGKSNKRKFNVNDFVSNKSRYYVKNSNIIKTDSFEFCQKYSRLRCDALGGYSISVTVTTPADSVMIFEHTTEDDCSHKVELRGYLLAYKLLNNKLPSEFPKAIFFTEAKIDAFLGRYYRTIECEDFYYEEFKKKHPERTSIENRMEIGWNFQKYLKERNDK